MNNSFNEPEPDVLAELFNGFKALQGRRLGVERPVLLADIVDYSRGGEAHTSKVEQALTHNLEVRRQLKRLVAAQTLAQIPPAAVAQDSTDMLNERLGQGFRLKFRQSQAAAAPVYVILELEERLQPVDGYKHVLMTSGAEVPIRLCFPPLLDGRAQVILAEDDPRLQILRHPDIALCLMLP